MHILEIPMLSNTFLIAALLLMCGLGGALFYASTDDRGSLAAVLPSHEQHTSGTAAHGTGHHHLNCHSHGPTTYHCH